MDTDRIHKLADEINDEIDSSISDDEMSKRNVYNFLVGLFEDHKCEACMKCRENRMDCPQRGFAECTKEYRKKHE